LQLAFLNLRLHAMESVHYVSTSSKVLFSKVRKIVPPMLEKFHKGWLRWNTAAVWTDKLHPGQLGRVAVIGGCVEYVLSIASGLFD